jgi:hypothetical protein
MTHGLMLVVSLSAVIGRHSTAAPPAAPKTAGAQPGDDGARLKFLAERFAEYHLFRDEDRSTPLKSTAEPVLRYSNPVRAIGLSDGVVHLWLHGARPVAAASLSIRQGGEMHRELTFLEQGPLTCIVEDATIWSPSEGGLKWAALSAAEPAANKSLRLVQMRSIARRFAATYYKSSTQESFELRVLSQPVYRYEDEASGTVDGAVFVFAEANDPETLLLLEAVTGAEGARSWRYGLARMSSVRMTVRLDDREVWSVQNYWAGPRSPADPYLEARDGKFWVDPAVETP